MLEPALASRCLKIWGIALPPADAPNATESACDSCALLPPADASSTAETTRDSCASATLPPTAAGSARESCESAPRLIRRASFAAIRSALGSSKGARPASLAWLDFFEDLEPTLCELLSPNRGLFDLQADHVRAEAVRAHCVGSPHAGREAARLLQKLERLESELSKKAVHPEAETFLGGHSLSAVDLVGAILLMDAFRFALPARMQKIQPFESVLQWLRACLASTELEGGIEPCSWSESDESMFEQQVLKSYLELSENSEAVRINGHANGQPASSAQADPWQGAMLDPWAQGLQKVHAETDQTLIQTVKAAPNDVCRRPPQSNSRDADPWLTRKNSVHTAGGRRLEDPWRNCGKKVSVPEKPSKSYGGLQDFLISFGDAARAYAASEFGFSFLREPAVQRSAFGQARGCFNRADFIKRCVHRNLQEQVMNLRLSDEQLMQLGQLHFKEQPRHLQQILRGTPEPPRTSRRSWPAEPPAAASHRDCDQFADQFEELEKPFWWKDDYASLCFDLQCTPEEELTTGAPPMKQWWDAEKIAESENFVAFSKPAGMFVVTDERGLWEESPTNFIHVAHRRVDMPSKNEPSQRGICHRLDSHTSGVQIFGKSWKAFRHFVVQNGCHRMQKEYVALLEGRLGGTEGPFTGVIDVPMYKWQDYQRREFGSISCASRGSPAVTKYTVLRHWRVPAEGRLAFWGKERWFTLVQLRILTGRTHQIRLHMAFLGHPLVGDMKYNSARFEQDCALVPRIFLHCLRMEFQDMDGETFVAASELCPDLQTVLCQLEVLSAETRSAEANVTRTDLVNFSGFGKILQQSVASRPPMPNPEAQAKQSLRRFCKHCQEWELAERSFVTRGKKSSLYWQLKRHGSKADSNSSTAEAETETPSSWGPDVLWVPTELKNMDAEQQVPTELKNMDAEKQVPPDDQTQT
eukprot:TRINITY_DN22030_c0_g1_i1.p1 TRINITY_DN22030_c0_g1~~TRINITY_DN22030_c0_g1_i1.p1  ORF type:complete len:925 (-),score=139.73 TRINITY_DN22030_c0_g1_i1:229-3003(-)